MSEYKKPELLIIYFENAGILTESIEGDIVEPGQDWE